MLQEALSFHQDVATRHDERPTPTGGFLALYLQGWSEADPAKIIEATGQRYEFRDPLVGRFSKQTLRTYFKLLRARFAVGGVVGRQDLAFTLRGPMRGAASGTGYEFWREAPLLGLTGVTRIKVTSRGVAGEVVAYDLNMACHMLRG